MSVPSSTSPVPDRGWVEGFNALAAKSHAIVGDDPTAVAVNAGGDSWELVNTATGAVTRADVRGTIIGVGAVDDGFLAITSRHSDLTEVGVEAINPSGHVDHFGSLPVEPSIGVAPPLHAHVVQHGTSVYVLVETQTNTANSIGNPATVRDGTIKPLATTIYGNLTFADDNTLLVTGGVVGAQRTESSDNGASWHDLPQLQGFPTILLSLDNTTAVGFAHGAPTVVATFTAGAAPAPLTNIEGAQNMLLVTAPDRPVATIVVVNTGQTIGVNRASGLLDGQLTQTFVMPSSGGFEIINAWVTGDGHAQAIINSPCSADPGCVPAAKILDGR